MDLRHKFFYNVGYLFILHCKQNKRTMSDSKNLGEFEILVLAALMHAGDDAYGARIRTEIETRASRSVSVGALYATLSRLENKGYVASLLGEATAVRGGRAKRFYQLTGLGREKLELAVSRLNAMLKGVAGWQDLPIR